MFDEIVISKETGEALTATQAIHEFYKTHGIMEAWTDEYELTGESATPDIFGKDAYLAMPDFTNVLA